MQHIGSICHAVISTNPVPSIAQQNIRAEPTINKYKGGQIFLFHMTHNYVHALLPVVPRHDQMSKLIHRTIQVHAIVACTQQGGRCHLG